MSDDARGVSVTRLHVPLSVMMTFLAVVLGGVVSMTVVWSKTTDHTDDAQVHINEHAAVTGGGVAYQKDVDQVEQRFEQRMLGEYRKTRKMLKAMTISCDSVRGQLNCKVDLPEPE
jgi:predicted helicase